MRDVLLCFDTYKCHVCFNIIHSMRFSPSCWYMHHNHVHDRHHALGHMHSHAIPCFKVILILVYSSLLYESVYNEKQLMLWLLTHYSCCLCPWLCRSPSRYSHVHGRLMPCHLPCHLPRYHMQICFIMSCTCHMPYHITYMLYDEPVQCLACHVLCLYALKWTYAMSSFMCSHAI